MTASPENQAATDHFLATQLDGNIARWELWAFDNLCGDQDTRPGLEWFNAQIPVMSAKELAFCEQLAKASGVNPEMACATGATRMVEPE